MNNVAVEMVMQRTSISTARLVVFLCAPLAACSSTSEAPGVGSGDAAVSTDSAVADATTDSATADAGSDSAATTPREFGEPCDTNADCKSNACFVGGNGSYCSIKCTPLGGVSTDCPKPLTTGDCNNKGFCKKP